MHSKNYESIQVRTPYDLEWMEYYMLSHMICLNYASKKGNKIYGSFGTNKGEMEEFSQRKNPKALRTKDCVPIDGMKFLWNVLDS